MMLGLSAILTLLQTGEKIKDIVKSIKDKSSHFDKATLSLMKAYKKAFYDAFGIRIKDLTYQGEQFEILNIDKDATIIEHILTYFKNPATFAENISNLPGIPDEFSGYTKKQIIELYEIVKTEFEKQIPQTGSVEVALNYLINIDKNLQVKNIIQPFKEISKDQLPTEQNIKYEEIFFTQKEHLIISKILDRFDSSKNTNCAYITSLAGQGKTIMSIKIGLELKRKKYLVIYLSLRGFSDSLTKTLYGINSKNLKICCIITDCHLNYEMFRRIYLDSTEFNNLKFIFESRLISEENLDIEQNLKFINEDDKYILKFNNNDVIEKYKGIISKFDCKIILTNKQIKRIIEFTGQNFILLHELLVNNKNKSQLSIEENSDHIFRHIYDDYFKNKYVNNLRAFATINQFEIPFKSNKLEENRFKNLLTNNIVIPEKPGSGYYNFYHSNFAKILIESYYRIHIEEESNKETFEFATLKNFILYENNNHTKLFDIFERIFHSKSTNLIVNLLSDNDIQSYTFEYFTDFSNFINIKNKSEKYTTLLEMVNNNISDYIHLYLSEIIFKNPSIYDIFLKDSISIKSLFIISKLVENHIPQKQDYFITIAEEIISANLQIITYHPVCQILYKSFKSDSMFFQIMLKNIDMSILYEMAKNDDLLSFTKGFSYLTKISALDYSAFDSFNLDFYMNKIKCTSLTNLAESLKIISKENHHVFAEEIFSNVNDDFIEKELSKLDLKEALNACNILKRFGYEKIYHILSIKKIQVSYSSYSFVEIIEILIELSKFSTSNELKLYLISQLDISLVYEKMKYEELTVIADCLHQLFKQYHSFDDIAKEIFEKISIEVFIAKLLYLSFADLGIILTKFSNIENSNLKHSKLLLHSVNLSWFSERIQDTSVGSFLNMIVSLIKIDKKHAILIYNNVKHEIVTKIKSLPFEDEIKVLSDLSKIDSDTAFQLLTDFLNNSKSVENWFITQNLQSISTRIESFQRIENNHNQDIKTNIVFDFFNSFNDSFYIEKILDYNFYHLMGHTRRLSKIGAKYSFKIKMLISMIDIKLLEEKIIHSSFLELSSGLSILCNIHDVLAKSLFYKSYNAIISSANKATLDEFVDGLNH